MDRDVMFVGLNKNNLKSGAIYTNGKDKYRKIIEIYNKSICVDKPRVVYMEVIRDSIVIRMVGLDYFAKWAIKRTN